MGAVTVFAFERLSYTFKSLIQQDGCPDRQSKRKPSEHKSRQCPQKQQVRCGKKLMMARTKIRVNKSSSINIDFHRHVT